MSDTNFDGEIPALDPESVLIHAPAKIPVGSERGAAMEAAIDAAWARGRALDRPPPKPAVPLAPLDQRTHIAAMAMSALLGRVDGKLPVQEGDQARWVAGAAGLAVKAADALLKELGGT